MYWSLKAEKFNESEDLLGIEKQWYGQLMTGPQMIAYLIQINNWLKSYNVKLV